MCVFLSHYTIHNNYIAGLGVLGSDLVLNNLELRLDALQDLIPIPLAFEITRGFIRVRMDDDNYNSVLRKD